MAMVVKLGLYSLLVIAAAAATVATRAARTSEAALPSHPLIFGSVGANELFGRSGKRPFATLRRAGMSSVGVTVSWRGTGPRREPAKWKPSDPSDSHYRWAAADAQISKYSGRGAIVWRG